jgi:hypothetical protein
MRAIDQMKPTDRGARPVSAAGFNKVSLIAEAPLGGRGASARRRRTGSQQRPEIRRAGRDALVDSMHRAAGQG